jgi:hypothetical protein
MRNLPPLAQEAELKPQTVMLTLVGLVLLVIPYHHLMHAFVLPDGGHHFPL